MATGGVREGGEPLRVIAYVSKSITMASGGVREGVVYRRVTSHYGGRVGLHS